MPNIVKVPIHIVALAKEQGVDPVQFYREETERIKLAELQAREGLIKRGVPPEGAKQIVEQSRKEGFNDPNKYYDHASREAEIKETVKITTIPAKTVGVMIKDYKSGASQKVSYEDGKQVSSELRPAPNIGEKPGQKIYSYSELNKRYSNLIKDEQFIGTEQEYNNYMKDFERAKRNQDPFKQDNPTISNALEIARQRKQDKVYFDNIKKNSQEYKTQLKAYKDAGYTDKEAAALADVSYYSQTSGVSPERTEKYLRKEAQSDRSGWRATIFGKKGIAPEEQGVNRYLFLTGKAAERGSNYIGSLAIEAANLPFKAAVVGGKEASVIFRPDKIVPVSVKPTFSYLFNQRLYQEKNLTPTQPQNKNKKGNVTNASIIDQSTIDNKSNPIFKYFSPKREIEIARVTPGEALVTTGLLAGGGGSKAVAWTAGLIAGAGSTGRAMQGLSIARESNVNPVRYYGGALKENPVGTLFDTAIIGGLIYSGARAYLDKPVIIKQPIPVSPDVETPLGIIKKPSSASSFINEQGQKVIETRQRFSGVADRTSPGSRTVVTTRGRELVNRFIKNVNPIPANAPPQISPIYSGNPYSNNQAYQAALKLLIKSGYTPSQAKEILRLRKPTFVRDIVTGEAIVSTVGGGEPTVMVNAISKSRPVTRTAEGISTRKTKSYFDLIVSEGKPLSSKGDTQVSAFVETSKRSQINKQGGIFNKLTEQGKTTTVNKRVAGIKEVGSTESISLYKQADINQRVIPKTTKVTTGRANILAEKGDPTFSIDLTSVQKSGRPSSQGLRTIQSQKAATKTLASQLSSLLTKPSLPTVKASPIPSPKPTVANAQVSSLASSLAFARTGKYKTTTSYPKVKNKTEDILSSRFFSNSKGDAKSKLDEGLEEKNKTSSLSFFGTGLAGGSRTGMSEDTVNREELAVIPRVIEDTKQQTEQQQVVQQVQRPIGFGFFPGERVPITPRPEETSSKLRTDRKKKQKQYDGKPYDTFVLIDATKGNKRRWVQVADNVPYETALGMGAGFVDQSNLSSRFKVVEDKGEINQVKSNVWGNIGYKFREYMIRKGTRISQQNTFIEKTKYRLDSPQERRQIQRARASSLLIGRRRR